MQQRIRGNKEFGVEAMVTVFENRFFEDLQDKGSGRTYQNLEFRGCYFKNCFAFATDPGRRPTFRNIRLTSCRADLCSINRAVFENVVVEDFWSETLFDLRAPALKHVVLRGQLARIIIHEDPMAGSGRLNKVYTKANAAFYASVDWALDIREAQFWVCDLRGVPGRLVRRNPKAQILVTRERVLARAAHLGELPEYWSSLLERFLDSGREDEVFVVGTWNQPYAEEQLAGLQAVRELGFAEPD